MFNSIGEYNDSIYLDTFYLFIMFILNYTFLE